MNIRSKPFARRSTLVAFFLSAVLTAVSVDAVQSNSTAVSARITAALNILQRFDASRKPDDVNSLSTLQSAIDAMESANYLHALTVENFVAQRRLVVEGWARIIKSIERSYDPAFDPNNARDVPKTCVIPPDGQTCGADASSIKDPNARAAYVAELQRNTLNLKRAVYYQRLHAMDMGAMTILQVNLRVFNKIAPEGVGPDFVALDNILRQTGLSNARRSTIDAMFYPVPGD